MNGDRIRTLSFSRLSPARLAILLTVLVTAACDDFTRFKQERYECNQNQHGLIELDFRSMKVGDEVAASFTTGTVMAVITESTKRNFTLTKGDMILRIDRGTGTVRVTKGSRYLNISCEKSEFRM